MKNLIQRSITGLLFVSVVIGSILIHPLAFAFISSLIILFGLLEFYKITKNSETYPNKLLGVVIGLLINFLIIAVSLDYLNVRAVFIIPAILLVVPIFELYKKNTNPLNNIALTVFGVLYVALPIASLNLLNHVGQYFLIGFFTLLWSNDTFAYIFGMSLGKHRLFERISPKKSWEGFIGGLLSTILISILLSRFIDDLLLWQWMGMAFIIVIFGTLGDLTESHIKRSLNIKDSGTILPGHGGILDRFDAVLLAAPFVTAYIFFLYL